MKTKTSFNSDPYEQAIFQIQTVEKKIVREIRAEAEKFDKQKEIQNFPSSDAS